MTETRRVLKEALTIVSLDHCTTQLAVNADGEKVRPLDPEAVAWSSTGALIRVAPSHAEKGSPQHTEAAWQAYILLCDAAEAQGYSSVVAVDEDGQAAAQRMFWKALSDERGRDRRRRGFPAVGSAPRGAA